MDEARHNAFKQLRGPCVQLSQIALEFRANQTTVKKVLRCLEDVHAVIVQLGRDSSLDAKLAEYAFFPLTHVFNESKRLSSRCLELAVEALDILILKGWRGQLIPELGQQLLLLMTLIGGGVPAQTQKRTVADDLRLACFQAITSIYRCAATAPRSREFFAGPSGTKVIDQTAFLLLESVIDANTEAVQLAASSALSALLDCVQERPLLASLLPRTVSSLVRALRPNGKVRRSPDVLKSDLLLLKSILYNVLRDDVSFVPSGAAVSDETSSIVRSLSEDEVLDASWLKATASQVQNALLQVSQSRNSQSGIVRAALADLAFMVLRDCSQTLADSAFAMMEVMVAIASYDDNTGTRALKNMRWLLTIKPSLTDSVKSLLYNSSLSLPRFMQGSDDLPKERAINQMRKAYEMLATVVEGPVPLAISVANTLTQGISASLQMAQLNTTTSIQEINGVPSRLLEGSDPVTEMLFPTLVLNHKGQATSTGYLDDFVLDLTRTGPWTAVARNLIDRIPDASAVDSMSLMWLTIRILRSQISSVGFEELVNLPDEDLSESKDYLISDLYYNAVGYLLDESQDEPVDWRLKAFSMECIALQADHQKEEYRPELIDTLYPVLSMLGSARPELQLHAIVLLNRLATACGYGSTKDLLIQNVDYLVNSIALKLNSFELSPQGPQVLLMMVRLCGAKLLPYLDDTIASIFSALDCFHGYPTLVEILFQVLKAIVEESAKQPQLALTNGAVEPLHHKQRIAVSTLDNICSDLDDIKKRNNKTDEDHELRANSFPRRPWSTKHNSDPSNDEEPDTSPQHDDDEDFDTDLSKTSKPKDSPESTLSKPYKLLLSIAKSTTPHLNSPSPQVRLTLLELISRIAPLLSRDENSFLPFINGIWPVVLGRFFGEVGDDGHGESAYNVLAAAETMERLCEGAGDFMSGRIEQILPRLERMWWNTWKKVHTDQKLSEGSVIWTKPDLSLPQASTSKISSAVVLQLVRQTQTNEVASSTPTVNTILSRTTHTQILNALISLLTTILTHVRISDEDGWKVLDMLAPIMYQPGHDAVRSALQTWNADAVWLLDERRTAARRRRQAEDEDWDGQEWEMEMRVDEMRDMPEGSAQLGFRPVVF